MYKFPLLNAIGISNTYGDHYNKKGVNNRSLMNFQIGLAWSIDETTESYSWFFEQLKNKVNIILNSLRLPHLPKTIGFIDLLGKELRS